MRYAFIAENRLIFVVRAMCRMLLVHPSVLYAWLREPFFQRALEDQRQTKLIKTAWEESGEVYGYRKLHDDLCDLGEDRNGMLSPIAFEQQQQKLKLQGV